jgi:hypothetical protein
MLEVAMSGFMVPAGDMPGVMRVLSTVSSVQHYLVIVRGVMLRGAGVKSLWLSGLALGGIALTLSALAWLRLRLGLDTNSLRRRLQVLWRNYQDSRHERKARRGADKTGGRGGKKPKLTREPAYADVRVEIGD